ncbi:MAG: chemotaxis protein CheD [bacterium]
MICKPAGTATASLEASLSTREKARVGVADMLVGKSPLVLSTVLGSCVGVMIYDPAEGIGGLCHIMLAHAPAANENPAKYADTAIPAMLRRIIRKGAALERLVAKIVGGANMFGFKNNSFADIGKNNVAAVRECLARENIPIAAQEVGGNHGRTVYFALESGAVFVKIKSDVSMIL